MWIGKDMQCLYLLVAYLFVSLVNCDVEKCDGKSRNFVAELKTMSFHSPNYPDEYQANDECTYVITTALPSEDYMLQITAIGFQLNDYKEDCNTDYLEIYEGDIASGTQVKKWCGQGEFVHKTRSDTLTLHFKSDDLFQDNGFTIFYSVVEYISVQCMESAGVPIVVGNFPLVEAFSGSQTMSRCEWKMETEDPSMKLLIEVFKPSTISCQDGVFNIYEGDSTSGHVNYQYCSTLNPFSQMYLNSNKAVLTLESTTGSTLKKDDDLILKISARSPIYACTSTNFATLEVEKDPVIFPLPYVVDGSGTSCPVTLLTSEESQYLRIDVMGSHEKEATCDSDLVDVTVSRRKTKLEKECNEATQTPVYRQSSTDGIEITHTSDSDTYVYVRASTVPKVCSGVVNKKQALEDLVVKETVPSKDGYPNLAHCKYLISAQKLGDSVSLNFTWDFTQLKKDLPGAVGDFIKIYDGDSVASPVLFSSQGKPELLENKVVNVVSTQKDMLLVLDSDARITGKAVQIAYFSLPGGNYCPSIGQKIMLGRQFQYITSPNYPDALPLHQRCLYHLVPENPNDDVIVEVIDSNLQTKCENVLMVYEGENTNTTSNMLGRVCGKDTPKFKLTNNTSVTLLTTSEDTAGPGGWKIKAYTQAKSTGEGSNSGNGADCSTRTSIWLLFLVFTIVGVLGIF